MCGLLPRLGSKLLCDRPTDMLQLDHKFSTIHIIVTLCVSLPRTTVTLLCNAHHGMFFVLKNLHIHAQVLSGFLKGLGFTWKVVYL